MSERRQSLLRAAQTLVGPIALVLLAGLLSLVFGESIELKFHNAFVITAMVVSVYVFTGNSGVISFGHVSFVALGAFATGMFSMDVQQKSAVFKELFAFIKDNHLGNLPTLLVATALGGLYALVVGIPLVRLNGLAAGIATFAVLGITRNVLRNWTKVGPGAKAIPAVEETTGLAQALLALILCVVVAYLYQRSPSGRRLRATREDVAAAQGVGVRIYRERLIAFALSGAMAGFAGAVYVHLLGSISTEQVYLELTFLVLAMLVVGGINSLWGAVLGGLSVSLVNTVLTEGEKGMSLFGWNVTLPTSTSGIVLAALMATVLLLRPKGLSNGREFRLPGTR
ncbi:MAG: branched-chain amino acid ABC transporter permease [Actinomycetota bacterium]|nr:branched-chain amino acid ABC transporter permease [Actinomycetota bacterium]